MCLYIGKVDYISMNSKSEIIKFILVHIIVHMYVYIHEKVQHTCEAN